MQSLIGSVFGIQFRSLEANKEQLKSYEAPKQQTKQTIDVTLKESVDQMSDRNHVELEKIIDVTSDSKSTVIA